MYCHKILLESLERILLEQFLAQEGNEDVFDNLPEQSKEKLRNLTQRPSNELLEEVVHDEPIQTYIRKYSDFRENVRGGELGKTGKFWIAYMDHIWRILALIRAVKTNDFLLYADSIHQMSDIFFSFDGQNYARYLTFFSIFLANLEETHPGAVELLKRGAMSVARSFIPGNRCAVDKTMEETFMRHAKSRSGSGSGSGITGIAGNYDAYQRWVRTTHEGSKYVELTLFMADMLTDTESGTWHRDLRPAEIQKSEERVSETIDAIMGFMDPFCIDDKEHLYCVSSGARVPSENEPDILNAEDRGKVARETFITEGLKSMTSFSNL